MSITFHRTYDLSVEFVPFVGLGIGVHKNTYSKSKEITFFIPFGVLRVVTYVPDTTKNEEQC